MEAEIKQSLTALLAAIRQAQGDVIAREMARLDDFAQRGELSLPPQLLHFLQRRSYAKALMYLDGDTPPAGICGGRAGRKESSS